MLALDLTPRSGSLHHWQGKVGDEQIGMFVEDELSSLSAVTHGPNVKPESSQGPLNQDEHGGIVLVATRGRESRDTSGGSCRIPRRSFGDLVNYHPSESDSGRKEDRSLRQSTTSLVPRT